MIGGEGKRVDQVDGRAEVNTAKKLASYVEQYERLGELVRW